VDHENSWGSNRAKYGVQRFAVSDVAQRSGAMCPHSKLYTDSHLRICGRSGAKRRALETVLLYDVEPGGRFCHGENTCEPYQSERQIIVRLLRVLHRHLRRERSKEVNRSSHMAED
jgi:hypothetical protein